MQVSPNTKAAADRVGLDTPSEELIILLSSEESDAFTDDLAKVIDNDSLMISDNSMRLSATATASATGSMTIAEAEHCIKETERMEVNMCLQNPLAFLYLSITEGMSKPLIRDSQYYGQDNSSNTRKIDKMLAREFANHPDAPIMTQLGLRSEMLTEWVVGNPTVRKISEFTSTLTRLWSAMVIREMLKDPDHFEELCIAYGFDRSSALELTSSLASRCQNLKNVSLAMHDSGGIHHFPILW
ncbi:Protein GlcT [Frankliniella fusca]|uniref:Protein GlcT n=1 Tax=Frankliniella fusca TaxID=407009 RepID=A0AAE1L7E4_9NEOP|nr:Protein GlcT [Frankliniella fusca]